MSGLGVIDVAVIKHIIRRRFKNGWEIGGWRIVREVGGVPRSASNVTRRNKCQSKQPRN